MSAAIYRIHANYNPEPPKPKRTAPKKKLLDDLARAEEELAELKDELEKAKNETECAEYDRDQAAERAEDLESQLLEVHGNLVAFIGRVKFSAIPVTSEDFKELLNNLAEDTNV